MRAISRTIPIASAMRPAIRLIAQFYALRGELFDVGGLRRGAS